MTQEVGRTGPAPGDYWEQEVTMTRAQLAAERDAWYANGIRNGEIRERRLWRQHMETDDRVAAL